MNIQLRPCTAADQEFLYLLYTGTRREEVSAWGWSPEQQDVFLRMQWTAQQRSYEMQYPEAEHSIILREGEPIGRMLVAHGEQVLTLVDIALLHGHRGQGIGGQLLRALIEQSDKERLPVRLQVLKTNPARRLYERLGFRQTGEDAVYFQMERLPC
jgi:ribosomal protein S18 acetylase RimI-like enzyme